MLIRRDRLLQTQPNRDRHCRFPGHPESGRKVRFSLMMKITCWMPWRTAAMTAASLALSVLENRLFVATCAVSVASWAGAGAREALEAGFGQLGIILIRFQAGFRPHRPVAAIAPAGIRARRRLPIDHVHRGAIAAEAHRVRVPTGRNETHYLVAAIGSAQRHHRDAIQIAIGHVELLLIRRERHAVGVRARILRQRGRHHRRGSDYRDGFDDRVRRGVDYVNRIRLVFDDIQAATGPRSASSCSVGPSPGSGPLPPAVRPDSLPRSRGRECWIHTLSRSLRFPSPPPKTDIRRPARPPARGRSCRGAGRVPVPSRPVAQASGEHRDRVVVVIRHHQRLAILRNSHAGGARMHGHLAVDRALRR